MAVNPTSQLWVIGVFLRHVAVSVLELVLLELLKSDLPRYTRTIGSRWTQHPLKANLLQCLDPLLRHRRGLAIFILTILPALLRDADTESFVGFVIKNDIAVAVDFLVGSKFVETLVPEAIVWFK